jgi:hypothetical protein
MDDGDWVRERSYGLPGAPNIFLFIFIYFCNLLCGSHRRRRRPKRPLTAQQPWTTAIGCGNGATGCQVRAISFFFVFCFFWTYFVILTGDDAVPNGREGPNATERRRTGQGSVVRAARCAPIFLFCFLFFFNLLFESYRRRRRPKRPLTAQRPSTTTIGRGNGATGCQVRPIFCFSFFFTFETYFEVLTGADAVPNGR